MVLERYGRGVVSSLVERGRVVLRCDARTIFFGVGLYIDVAYNIQSLIHLRN